jgi:hypothetical protein
MVVHRAGRWVLAAIKSGRPNHEMNIDSKTALRVCGVLLCVGCGQNPRTREQPFRDTVQVTEAAIDTVPSLDAVAVTVRCVEKLCRSSSVFGSDGRRAAILEPNGRILVVGADSVVIDIVPIDSFRPRLALEIRPDGDGVTYIDHGGLRVVHTGMGGSWSRALPWSNISRGIRLGASGVSLLNVPPARHVGDAVDAELEIVEWGSGDSPHDDATRSSRSVRVTAPAFSTDRSDLEPLRPLFWQVPEWSMAKNGRIVWASPDTPRIGIYDNYGRPQTLIALDYMGTVPNPSRVIDSAAAVLRSAAFVMTKAALRKAFEIDAEVAIRDARRRYPLVAADKVRLTPLASGSAAKPQAAASDGS